MASSVGIYKKRNSTSNNDIIYYYCSYFNSLHWLLLVFAVVYLCYIALSNFDNIRPGLDSLIFIE